MPFLAGQRPPTGRDVDATMRAMAMAMPCDRPADGGALAPPRLSPHRPGPRPSRPAGPELIGISPAIVAIREEVETLAGSTASVLITGPSGSGKDVVAQLLHQRSDRAAAPFLALNCAAVARDLLESEMFGHEAGAFTGALKARAGRFEAAHGGTLFLDEVGDMALAMQAKLLRALETRVVERVGGMLPIPVDVRIIAATSIDLIAAIDRGNFRSDLLYRLDVIRIDMPPLAERREDVPVLVDHFLAQQRSRVRFTPAAMASLGRHDWPGNVRELRNVVARAEAHFPGRLIDAAHLPKLLRSGSRAPAALAAAPPRLGVDGGVDLKRILTDMETAYIQEALNLSGGAVAATAKLLGLQRTTLIEKMRRLGIAAA